MNVLITGIYGFIGSNLGQHLASHGHKVYGTTTDPAKAATKQQWLNDCYTHRLGTPPKPEMFDKIDAIIHLAHDFRSGSLQTNVDGTIELAMQASKHALGKQIFVSSYSAHQNAISEYGRTKYKIEPFFKKEGNTVIRPGLVMGNGGLFGRMAAIVMRSPITPLIDGGTKKQPIIDIDSLCAAIEAILTREFSHSMEFNIFHPKFLSMGYILRKVSEITRHKTIFIHVPSRILITPMMILQKTGIRMPITADNLRGYTANMDEIHHSDIDRLLEAVPSPDDMITEALHQILHSTPPDNSLAKATR